METVQNKVAVVTGAASGIGLGMTRALTGAGAHVAMLDVEDEALSKAQTEFDTANVDVRAYRCDVSDAAQVEDVAGVWAIKRPADFPRVLGASAGALSAPLYLPLVGLGHPTMRASTSVARHGRRGRRTTRLRITNPFGREP